MSPRNFLKTVLHFFWRFSRPLTIGVRAVVQDKQGRVLLVKHTYVPGWYLPGGGVETGETFEEAVRKELMEEASVRCTGRPELVSAFHNPRGSKRDHVLLYLVKEWDTEKEFVPNKEIAEIGFFALDDLPEDITPATRRRLDEVFKGEVPTEQW